MHTYTLPDAIQCHWLLLCSRNRLLVTRIQLHFRLVAMVSLLLALVWCDHYATPRDIHHRLQLELNNSSKCIRANKTYLANNRSSRRIDSRDRVLLESRI